MSRPSAHPARRSKGGRQTHKNYCKKERRNKPKKNKQGKPTWCKYCADKVMYRLSLLRMPLVCLH